MSDANTFEKVARQWWEHWKGPKSPRHADYVIRRLEADVFPALGARPAASVTAPQLLAMAKAIEARGAVDIAKRSLQTCGQILRFAVAHGLIERNPAADVRPSDALKPRTKENYARLDAKEMPELLRKIEAYQGSAYTRLAMKLIALTMGEPPGQAAQGCRRDRTPPAGRLIWHRPAFLPLLSLGNCGDSGDKPEKPSNGAGLRPVGQWGQIGDIVGTKWGHFYMMKIHSIIHTLPLPAPTVPRCPGPAFAGQPCTFAELSAKGPSLGALHRAAKVGNWTI
jgi:hypothetical protein